MTVTQQTLERLLVGLTINQIVLFEDREHVHIMVSERGDYERTTIITVQAVDGDLVVDIVGPNVPESPNDREKQ